MLGRNHADNQPIVIRTETHMDRLVVTIEVEPVEGRIGNHPLCHLQHAFVFYEKIHRGAQPLADRPSPSIQLVGSMLIRKSSQKKESAEKGVRSCLLPCLFRKAKDKT